MLPFLALTLALMIALGLLAYGRLASRPTPVVGSVDKVDPAQAAALQAAWGLRITNVAVTANGGFVDVRFQVLDPDKALGIMAPETHPVLIDQATGIELSKGGTHGHTQSLRAGATYYMLYQNPGGVLKPGSRVTVRIGDVTLENVIVR